MKALRLLAGAVLGVKLGVLLVNAALFPRLKRAQPVSRPSVSLLVPARDEALNLRRNLPGLLLQGALEVLVLDDGSSDGTAGVARELGATVISGSFLPPGWRGKPWACAQLGRAARGELLVFTDADVTWEAGALDALLARLEGSRADLLSIFPRQRNESWGERLLTPLVDDVLLTLFPVPLLALPFSLASAANGQVMAFRRGAYLRLGGHAAVRGELLEDVALGRRVKGAGGRLGLALGADLVSVRMYGSYPESVAGFGKNVLSFHGHSRFLLLATWAFYFAVYTLPLLRRDWPLVGLALLEGLLVRRVTGRTRGADLLEVLFVPVLPLLSLPVYRRAVAREVTWKGRTYDQGARL